MTVHLELSVAFRDRAERDRLDVLATVIVLRFSVDSISESASISQEGNLHLFSML